MAARNAEESGVNDAFAIADHVFLLKYFLSSQSAILWMCVLFVMSTVFYWIGFFVKAEDNTALSVLVVYVHELWVALPAMALVGMAWISVANSLTVSAQLALPDWVRARGMAIYQTALMGG